MGFLSPALLLLGLGIAIPLLLHLLRHGERIRVVFPAFRYLHRTEREHARRIRARQLLLLLLRCVAILLLAAAAARPFLPQGNDGHRATAVAIVVDNSLSSGRILGERRVLDTLVSAGLATLERSGPDDRFWVLPAAEPWEVAAPGPAGAATQALRDIRPTDAAVDLERAVERARALVAAAGLEGAEVHLLTDLQASGFPLVDAAPNADSIGADRPPVLVFSPTLPPFANHSVGGVLVNGGLPPLIGEPITVSAVVSVSGADSAEAGRAVAARIVIDEEVRSVLRVVPPATATFEIPGGELGTRINGAVELDPDGIRADDRGYFAIAVRAPPRVRPPSDSPFLQQALAVLSDAGRIRDGGMDGDVVFLSGSDVLPPTPGQRVVVIVPPSDPTLLPAVNRRLEQLETGVRFGVPESLPGPFLTFDVPVDAPDSVRVWTRFPLETVGAAPRGTPLGQTADGGAWGLFGSTGSDRWVVLGSPVRPDATTLPVSATLYSLIDWLVTGAGISPGGSSREAGDAFGTPPGATAVRTPSGDEVPVDGARMFMQTSRAGVYRILSESEVIAEFAVNPARSESEPSLLDPGDVEPRLGAPAQAVSSGPEWARTVFLERRGRELAPWLLGVLIIGLIAESVVASVGGRAEQASPRTS